MNIICVAKWREVTCRPAGSKTWLALVLLDLMVTEFERDERRLRAEERRDDGLLSATQRRANKTGISHKPVFKIDRFMIVTHFSEN